MSAFKNCAFRQKLKKKKKPLVKLTTNRLTLGLGLSAVSFVEFKDSNLALKLLVESSEACSESSIEIALLPDSFSGSQCSNLAAKDLARAAFCACNPELCFIKIIIKTILFFKVFKLFVVI